MSSEIETMRMESEIETIRSEMRTINAKLIILEEYQKSHQEFTKTFDCVQFRSSIAGVMKLINDLRANIPSDWIIDIGLEMEKTLDEINKLEEGEVS